MTLKSGLCPSSQSTTSSNVRGPKTNAPPNTARLNTPQPRRGKPGPLHTGQPRDSFIGNCIGMVKAAHNARSEAVARRVWGGSPVGVLAWSGSRRCRLGVPPELEEVVGCRDELPFAVDGGKAASGEAS